VAELELEHLEPKSFPVLNGLWERSPKYLFHLPSFSAAVGGTPKILAIRKGDEYVAAFFFVQQQGKLEKRWLSPYFAPFCGVLAPAECYETNSKTERYWRDVLGVLADSTAQFPDCCTLIGAPGHLDFRALQWKDWDVEPHYNYVSRWAEAGSWWEDWDNNVKRQVNKAREEGLQCVVHTPGKSDVLRKLWVKNAAHQGLDPNLADSLEALGNWLQQVESGFLVVVQSVEGVPHAAGLFANDFNRVYYLAGASDPELHGSGGPTLLHARALEEIDHRNLPHCYDWVGANTDNIVTFKRKFNPQLEVLMKATWKSRKSSWLSKLRG
jgi:hypothetical protein